MEVVIDGYIYQVQKMRGISRIFNEVLPLIRESDPSISLKIILHAKKSGLSEQVMQVIIPKLDKHLLPLGLWKELYPFLNNLLINQKVKITRNTIFHSTYYRSLAGWRGKQIFSVYDLIYEKHPDTFNDARDVIHLKSQAFKRADHLICISNATKADLVHYYNVPEEKISISHLGYGEQFRPVDSSCIDLRMDAPFILYVGGRAKYKGFSDLITAYSHWRLRHDLKLVVVGNEWTKQEVELLSKLGIQSQVQLLGRIDDKQLCDLYNQARAFVYPSHDEGFGLPLLEAMACACPVIASSIPSTREVAGEMPFYFEVAKPESLTDALGICIEKNTRDADQVKAGLVWVKKYSWQKTAQAMIDVYHAV
jgi:glycosyltransferase involved in cell wall biosynthesis